MQLEAKDIGFKYSAKGTWVLRHVHICLRAGEMVGLEGPSGCGKTTLGRILAGYEQPQEGEVLLHGASLPRQGCHPVQLIFQHPEKAVNPRLRLRHMLHEGLSDDPAFLQQMGIDPQWLNRWPGELSGGELQRLCAARALGPSTRFLIADEMTTMFDAITQAQIWQAVLALAHARQLGVLVISHDPDLLGRICDRVLSLTQLSGGCSETM